MFDFKTVDAQVVCRLASDMDKNGYAVLPNALSPEDLQSARHYINDQASLRDNEYFAVHGIEAMEDSLFGSLGASPAFRQLLAELYEIVTGEAPAIDERIFPVIRCLEGQTGLKESHFYHFDATAVTALAPVVIPVEGEHCGDLIMFPNIRNIRSSAIYNIVEKAILHNSMSKKICAFGVRRGWLHPIRIKLVPGNLYLFWGYRSLHCNDQCDPTMRRATGLYHFGNPHRESILARKFLGSNKRKAKLDENGLRPVV
ncbi:MAG TPA: hypothetical protein ENI17_11815 [Pseudomonas xinjiangensis]|uniref:Phytanoyl-CoA dioxygenase (PhyH) n=2 Tax=root TaxID=1 RepID=A0A7V1FQK3_9GAMM|nr:hypothetical protein [Halopseudomonas xinjiangensis]HEC48299.1 hypothetical protein [Halopseudomonas xinjiangensis]